MGVQPLRADPIRDVEAWVVSEVQDPEILPPKRRKLRRCRATLVHSARVAERAVLASQCEGHLATVSRNADRLGASLQASGLADAPDADANPPRKKPRKAPKKGKRKRRRAASDEDDGAADDAEGEPTGPDRFCSSVEPLPAAELSTKLSALVSTIRGRGKVVVFSQFAAALEVAQRALKAEGVHSVAPALLPKPQRPAAVSAFVNEDGVDVCLLTLDHGQSAGLTLTCAATVVLLDPVLDTSIEDQAIARVHRIGQSRPVEAIRLVATDTVDETILELQALRRGQKKGVQGTGDLRVAELVKLFAIEEDA
mmetsp:Transcript_35464/g.106720  ORF Transcript_35464/g.106720 Transcript_35464/m.106720 type:complete len:311 (+) Transcript_35464:1-933(+)